MKSFLATGALTLTLLLAGCGGDNGGGNGSAASGPAPAAVPAPNGDWTQIVSATPAGGFVMGNPDARVKLVEYASMTCPHCGEFAETGFRPLVDKYVKTGNVSIEIRSFVRDPLDMAATILSRCGGATPFFPLTEQLFAAQEDWMGRIQNMPQAEQQRLQGLPPQQIVATLAEQAGLIDFVRMRGITPERARQCLSNQSELDRLVQLGQRTVQEHPNFPGTPSFVINGKLVEGASSWALLEPKIQEALR